MTKRRWCGLPPWRYVRKVPLRARLRFVFNWATWPLETCQDCGRRNMSRVGSYWLAPDDLWNEVIGRASGILCPDCFTRRANAAGIRIHWTAVRS